MSKPTAITVGQFARELVLQLEPLSDLLLSWDLTEAEFEDLKKSEFFQNELRSAVKEVREMGPDAGFITRAKILSEEFLKNVVSLMDSNTTPPEVKVNIFKHITDLARLQPAKGAAAYQPTGPQVIFNFGKGMPGVPETLTIIPEKITPSTLPPE